MEAAAKAIDEEYKKNRKQIIADIEALIQSGNFVEAQQRATKYTAQYLRHQDPDLSALKAKATEGIGAARERELLAAIASTAPTQYHQRLLYYAELEKLRPENTTYRAEWGKNRSALDRVEEKDRKKALAADRAERRSKGVRLGMTAEEVLMSKWGRPEHINRTTSLGGTREQWVYGGRNYLYFENGILTSIQN